MFVRRSWITVGLAIALVLSMGTAAFATASSARIDKGTHPSNGFNFCGRSEIRDVADNVAHTYTLIGSSCYSSGANSQSGWLGSKANGYRDGAYCGTTGYAYNSGQAWYFAVGSHLCSNPSGNQNFHTISHHRAWNVLTESYKYMGSITSPSQTY